MRDSSYFEECHEAYAFVFGVSLGVAIASLTYYAHISINNPKELVCRNGNLYEVITYDKNITAYNPRYLECSSIN